MTDGARSDVEVEEWGTSHPRFPEFLRFLQAVAPDQLPFVVGPYYASHPSHLLVALEGDTIIGAIRFAIQPIGPEARCPVVQFDGAALTEAKIHVFAVRPESRDRDIGTRLQKWVTRRARDLRCYTIKRPTITSSCHWGLRRSPKSTGTMSKAMGYVWGAK